MAYPMIYLASRTEEANQILKRRLEPLLNEFNNARFASVHTQGLARSMDEDVDLVFLNFQDWGRHELAQLIALREAGYMGPVIVLAKAEASEALKTLRVMENVIFVEKPFETRDLIGIATKALSAREVAQRIYRRYETDEKAEVQFFGQNEKLESKLRNLSKGGAFLEFSQQTAAKVGDMVRVRLELDKVNRVYTMPAKIVWTQREESGRQNVGVEFVGPGDVKKTILGV